MKKRICFINNNQKTQFFHAVAQHFDKSKFDVLWIAVNARQHSFLTAHYGSENVLYLPLSTPNTGSPQSIKINDLIFADRRLKNIPDRGLRYLRNIQTPLIQFLQSEVPTLIVGELTHAYEVLIHRLVHSVLSNCRWASPFLTRFPSKHFAFFADESFSREVYPCSTQKIESISDNETASDYKKIIQEHIRQSNRLSFFITKAKRFVTLSEYDPEDPTWASNSRLEKLIKNYNYITNRLSYHWVPKVGIDAISACSGRSVIFPLHLQPELNIDTCGRYYENQSETILKIWRQLGPNDTLFIKEHPVAIGNRGYRWFQKLLHYPKIKVLYHNVPLDALLKGIDYVFTISGTMGFEAALLGKRVLCLAPTTYDRLENVVTPTLSDFRLTRNIDHLYEMLHSKKEVSWSIEKFKAHISQYAYNGDPEADRIGNPTAWKESNIQLVAGAFINVLENI